MTDAAPLFRVETAAVRAAWPHVRDRLTAMAARDRLANAWNAEDVYLQLMCGQVHLWTTPDYCGFVVLATVFEPYRTDLNVWIAVNSEGARADQFMPQLLEIAAGSGCQRVVWLSRRRGWGRLFPEAEVEYEYSIRVGTSDVG